MNLSAPEQRSIWWEGVWDSNIRSGNVELKTIGLSSKRIDGKEVGYLIERQGEVHVACAINGANVAVS
jgi:hypothetical protein